MSLAVSLEDFSYYTLFYTPPSRLVAKHKLNTPVEKDGHIYTYTEKEDKKSARARKSFFLVSHGFLGFSPGEGARRMSSFSFYRHFYFFFTVSKTCENI